MAVKSSIPAEGKILTTIKDGDRVRIRPGFNGAGDVHLVESVDGVMLSLRGIPHPVNAGNVDLVVTLFYWYQIAVQAHGSDIKIVHGVDSRPPAEVRAAWLLGCKTQAERGRKHDHASMLASMQNQRLGKQVEDGLQEATLEDVQPPPEDFGTEAEQLTLSGREDGSGYVSVVAGLVVGISCDGKKP